MSSSARTHTGVKIGKMDKDGDKKGGDKKGGQSGAGLGGAAGVPDPASLLDAASLFGK